MGPFLRVLVAWLSAVCGTTVQANPTDAALVEEIVIYGRATPQIGHVTAASEGVVGYDDIALPPLLRVGELVEAVPGMVATQHSGTGKANQYFLRGFNLDHGTDFSAAVEGAPINMRSHGHGQGYLDLNFLIPELIETTTYRKGPYTASTGDFSSAGGVAFNLYDELEAGVLSVGAGENDYYRLLAADTLTLGGETERYSLQGDLDFGAWRIAVYALTYDFALYSNFTYFLDDQQDGDEFEQRDARAVYGASVTGAFDLASRAIPTTFRWGVETRFDDIDEVGLNRTAARQRLSTIRDDAVEELSVATWGEAELEVTERLRAVVGVRGDYFDFDVDSFTVENSGTDSDHVLGFKAAAAYRLLDGWEVYTNWGQGFHSNDVRGVTITIDPLSRDPVENVDALVESEGAELGTRLELGRRFNVTFAAFWLELDSELVYVGDAGATEPNGATERHGIEVAAFWQANEWLALNAAYAMTDAEYRSAPSNANEIPGAVESTATLGATAFFDNGFSTSVRARHLGEASLIEDDSVRTEDSLLVNAGVGYQLGRLSLALEVFNLFDSDDADIAYFFPSRLGGEPADGVEDIHFHPLEPRSVRATLGWSW